MLPGEIERGRLDDGIREYHAAVAAYRRGGDDALARLESWDLKSLERVLAGVGTTADEARPWDHARLKAAAMLHTDVAVRLLDRAEIEAAVAHLGAAGLVLKTGGPEVRLYSSRWHQAVARMLRARNLLLVAESFLESARARLPQDATILYESGVLQELLATDTTVPLVIQLRSFEPVPSTPRGTAPRRLDRDVVDAIRRRRAASLNRATGWLRASLARDSANALARLHLGRVQTMRGEDDEARRLLEDVRRSGDPAEVYLATLFGGVAHERQGKLDAAADAYRDAIERQPLGHAAYVALSAVLQRSGRGDESREVLRRAVDAAPRNRRDPLWSYLAEPAAIAVLRFDRLREEARR